MTSYIENQAYDLLKIHGRMSPSLLANKLKISTDKAHELCLASWSLQAHEWFTFRMGSAYEELLVSGK